MPSPPELSVVLCSLNGAEGVSRCLRLLAHQTPSVPMEVVVVDDGSTDDTAAVAADGGARVVRHDRNRGLAAARNTGIRASRAPLVAFLDDDCEPEPQWAKRVRAAYHDPGVVGVGGPVLAPRQPGFMGGFLARNNPLGPLELELSDAQTILRRFALYLARQWAAPREDRRPVHALVGANMSLRRTALESVGGFDERFRFGAEELDLCLRVRAANPDRVLLHEPGARIHHSFRPELRDTLRRSRAYGRGSARMFRKWPSHTPTVFPFPILVASLLAVAPRRPGAGVLAAGVAQLMFPGGLKALASGHGAALLDPYVRLAQEAAENVGFAQGLWRFRNLEPMAPGP